MAILTTPPPRRFPPFARGHRCPLCQAGTYRIFVPPLLLRPLLALGKRSLSYRTCHQCGWRGLVWTRGG